MSTFKPITNDDVVSTRTLLHEAIPITGTICSGTYTNDGNIKTFSHGMFESVYDYPYLSSSANHIFDVTYGWSSTYSASIGGDGDGRDPVQAKKKVNIYNQMSQVLMGYNESGSIRNFDSDGTLDDDAGSMHQCIFVNFSRLLVKDEIKKNSFRMKLYTKWDATIANTLQTEPDSSKTYTLGDYNSANEFRTSPSGDYGLVYKQTSDTSSAANSVGLIFYQAGIMVLTSSLFTGDFGWDPTHSIITSSISLASISGTIENLADGFRRSIADLDFNNTIELNSSIYFCRVNHNEFNYSANPTYISNSKLVVKNNYNDLPVTYLTTVGLYGADNELLAVAKLSEPIRKDPNTELTLRVRLDY